MLELHKSYCIKEIDNLKDFVIIAYVIIDDIYKKVTPAHIANRCNTKDAIMSDSEIFTISIVVNFSLLTLKMLGLVFLKRT